jgi:hypothetical protein
VYFCTSEFCLTTSRIFHLFVAHFVLSRTIWGDFAIFRIQLHSNTWSSEKTYYQTIRTKNRPWIQLLCMANNIPHSIFCRAARSAFATRNCSTTAELMIELIVRNGCLTTNEGKVSMGYYHGSPQSICMVHSQVLFMLSGKLSTLLGNFQAQLTEAIEVTGQCKNSQRNIPKNALTCTSLLATLL